MAILSLGLWACAAGPVADIRPGEGPSLGADEQGLWMMCERHESDLRSSGYLVSDAALDAYLRDVVCRLSADYCPLVRIYVVDIPYFNATMAPNGMLEVWTGLLLRVHNEAQLASILGHELTHYQKRHSLKSWRDRQRKGDLLAAISVATDSSEVGSAAWILGWLSILHFSRENEREADRGGFDLLTAAGYDPREAAKVWAALIEELEAEDESGPVEFLSTHPAAEERVAALTAAAASRGGEGGYTGREAYLEHVLPLRGRLLEAELRQRRFEGAKVILERWRAEGEAVGEIDFYLGELYRERGEPGDTEQALAHYQRAAEGEGVPPENWRSMGWLYQRRGDDAAAREAFTRYLELEPAAADRALLTAWLAEHP